MNKKIQTINDLIEQELIKKTDVESLIPVIENFSLAITKQMSARIDKNNENDPIAKQFVPSREELNNGGLTHPDPVGDEAHTKIKGIIHRYPDRCLFLPLLICPLYCRFCFRKEKVGHASKILNLQEMQQAFNYIQEHQEIWEVIITGGDPLMLTPKILKNIMEELAKISHVDVIRFHTRVPVVDPARITKEMIRALRSHKAVYVILHANHTQEFTFAASRACAALIDAGIPMLSQSVLLKDINDNIDALSSLMRCFIKNRIKPYYLHHADLTRGTAHFRTSIQKGQELMCQLRGRFSGLCQPTYVLDVPGGYGKVPVGSCYIHKKENQHYEIADYLGKLHQYVEVEC